MTSTSTSTETTTKQMEFTPIFNMTTGATTEIDYTSTETTAIDSTTTTKSTRVPTRTPTQTTTPTITVTSPTTGTTSTHLITTSQQVDTTTIEEGSIPLGLIGGVIGGLVAIVLLVVIVVVVIVFVRKRKPKPSNETKERQRKISTLAPGMETIKITEHMSRPPISTYNPVQDDPDEEPPYQNHEIVQIVDQERQRKISQSGSLYNEQLQSQPKVVASINIDSPHQEAETTLTETGLTENKENEVSYVNLNKLDRNNLKTDDENESISKPINTNVTSLSATALPHKPSYAHLPDISEFTRLMKSRKVGKNSVDRQLSSDNNEANVNWEGSNNSQSNVKGYVNVNSKPIELSSTSEYSQIPGNGFQVPTFDIGSNDDEQSVAIDDQSHVPPVAHSAPRVENGTTEPMLPLPCKGNMQGNPGYVNINYPRSHKPHSYINMSEYDVPEDVPVHAKSLPDLNKAFQTDNSTPQMYEITVDKIKPTVAAKPKIPKKQNHLHNENTVQLQDSGRDNNVDDTNPYKKPKILLKPVYDTLPGSRPIDTDKGHKTKVTRSAMPMVPEYQRRVSDNNEKRYS